MAKNKRTKKRKSRTATHGESGKSQDKTVAWKKNPDESRFPAALRETIESIVIAFVLAFLFRTFEAEAFVIPTGSMAPTLMGRHKDLECPKCGYPYQVGASDEVFPNTGTLRGPAHAVVSGICPMCRYRADIGSGNPRNEEYKSYNGDRILVGKFDYEFSEPDRWDVMVFKYPGQSNINYVKRLVGLPNETVRITHGDVYGRAEGEEDFSIARKPPNKQLAMMQTVYNNDFVIPEIIELGWPARWQPMESSTGSSSAEWITSDDYRSFSVDGSTNEEVWLRYQHFVPSTTDWLYISRGDITSRNPRPQLITDFCAYNTGENEAVLASGVTYQGGVYLHWVGDLAVQCTMEVNSPAGEIVFELVEGGRAMQCRINVASGTAALSISGLDSYNPTGITPIRGKGRCNVMFANIDDQLRLWINGKIIEFDKPTTYPPLENNQPTMVDLSPVGVGSRGAAVRISHLNILRDVYYIAERSAQHLINSGRTYSGGAREFGVPLNVAGNEKASGVLTHPERWGAANSTNAVEFDLDSEQYLMLGDNSARSSDSRLWEQKGFEYYVSRELLIGKALYIYWPHSWDKLPGTNIPFPYFPNIQRMGLVR